MSRGKNGNRSRRFSWVDEKLQIALVGLAAVAVGALSVVALTSTRQVVATAEPRTVDIGNLRDSRPLIAFVGDSYTSGSQMDSGEEFRWPARLSRELNLRAQLLTSAGRGYDLADEVNFSTVIGPLSAEADTVVLFGSRNDDGGYEATAAGVEAVFDVIQERAPDATVVVVGPPWVNGRPPEWVPTARDAVRDVAAQSGARFVDPLEERWFADTLGLIGEDTVHPNDDGHTYLLGKMRPLVIEALGG
ncbi:SGNH/GDSL hydrolase family protein [Marisediminicola sp. LYQ134]|uniref:SGNH/GDSL hydrolase family protein n=1 Tax=Marisediminicola sp. LYQ134 TaxID=3391061 RepID=UPI003983A919